MRFRVYFEVRKHGALGTFSPTFVDVEVSARPGDDGPATVARAMVAAIERFNADGYECRNPVGSPRMLED